MGWSVRKTATVIYIGSFCGIFLIIFYFKKSYKRIQQQPTLSTSELSAIHPPTHPPTYLWLYTPLLNLGRFFSSLWTGDQPAERPLPAHRAAQTQNKSTQTSMPQVGFEPKMPTFQRTKTATVIGQNCLKTAETENSTSIVVRRGVARL
jgi:hypothetical protein